MSSKTEIIIDGNNKGAVLAINGVKQELTQLGNYVGGPFGSSMNMLSKHLAFAGVVAGVSALAALTKQAINSADEIFNMSQRVGLSVESLSTLKYAADLSNLSLEKMEGGLKKLSVNLYDVAHGTGKDAALAFNEIGVSALDMNNQVKPTEEVLLDVAEKFSLMEDGTNKSALAIKLFGKSGMEMIPFLNQGKEGIKGLTKEAEELGLKMSTDFAAQAESFNDHLTTMDYMVKGVGLTMAESLMPTLFNVSESMIALAKNQAIASTTGEAFAGVLKGLVTLFGGVYAGIYTAGTALGTFYGAIATLIDTGSFSQAANVISMGFGRIEDGAKGFGDAFENLWSGSGQDYKKLVELLNGSESTILSSANSIKILYDAFGHPIDSEGNLTNNIKYIQALLNSANIPGPDAIVTNMPSFNMDQIIAPEFDPLAGVLDSTRGSMDEIVNITSQGFDNMASAMQNAYQLGGASSQKAFNLFKALAIAQATISGYQAVMFSYTEGTKYGGPILGAIFAATAGAFAISQIAKIQSATYNSGSSGGGGRSIGAGGANITQQKDPGTSNHNPGQTIIYNTIIQGSVWDPGKFAREITPYINIATADGVK